jgi:tetratricopeptide (TPR) repeat protein
MRQEEAGQANQQTVIPVTLGQTGNASFQDELEAGEVAARQHEYHRAHESLARAEAMNPSSIRMLRARGAVFLAEGNIDEAEKYFNRAIALDGNDPKTLSGLGMCAMQRKVPTAAYDHLVKALRIAPDQLVAMLQLIECSYALDRFNDLESSLRRYMELHPEDLDMMYCLAGCLYKMNRFGEARQLVEKVLSARADHAGAQQLLELLEKAAATTPLVTQIETEVVGPSRTTRPGSGSYAIEESADGAIGAIEELKQRGDFEAVKKSCGELLARSGLTAEQIERATVLQAEGEILTGELVKGAQLYDQVLTRNPHSPRALSGKGALAAHEGDWVGARDYFERALRSNPRFDVALAGMGMCSTHFGENERAWDFYIRATQSNVENTRAILGLIELGYPWRRFVEIETALKAYLELHPADLDFVYSLAGCLYVQGKREEALEAVSRIELFEPNNERARELRQAIEGTTSHQSASR